MTLTMEQFATVQQLGLWFFSALGMFVLASMVEQVTQRRWLRSLGVTMSGISAWLLVAYVCDGAPWWFMPCWW